MRKSLATFLAASGVPQRIAQAHMRHTDPRLTAVTYTDETLLPVAATIGNLPHLPTAWPALALTPPAATIGA
jgi:integrase